MARSRSAAVVLALLLAGCTVDQPRDEASTSVGDGDGVSTAETSGDGDGDGNGNGNGDGDDNPTGDGDGDGPGDLPPACEPEGTVNCPIVIDKFPRLDARDTMLAPADDFDSYACAPATDESGREFVYRIDAPTEGIVTAWVSSAPGADVDVHLLGSADPDDCITRDNITVGWRVPAGSVYLIVDTWVDADQELASAYDLRVDFLGSEGNCGLELVDQGMFWQSCDLLDSTATRTPGSSICGRPRSVPSSGKPTSSLSTTASAAAGPFPSPTASSTTTLCPKPRPASSPIATNPGRPRAKVGPSTGKAAPA